MIESTNKPGHTNSNEHSNKWLQEQKREDVIEEIIYNSSKTNLTDLKRIGWTNGFPVRLIYPCHMFTIVTLDDLFNTEF